MDSRHESLKEGLLNHVIMTINTYIIYNTDELMTDEIVQNEISDICKRIYHYLGVQVDTDNILAKHNLLSIDVVLFPQIPDPEGRKILNDSEFENLVNEIKNILNNRTATSMNVLLRKQIFHVLEEYKL